MYLILGKNSVAVAELKGGHYYADGREIRRSDILAIEEV